MSAAFIRAARESSVASRDGHIGEKANCLVLDFGGNVLRHGPVDALRVESKPNGTGAAPAKECPKCHSLIATGFSVCPDCGYEFPPPERNKHDARATDEGILSGQVTITTWPVTDVYYAVHAKRGAPPDAPKSMRVEYQVGLNRYYFEWICFEHEGFARQKAEAWWKLRSIAHVPETADEALRLAEAGALAKTTSITVRRVAGEYFDRIVGYLLSEKPAWREPGWDEQDPAAACDNRGGQSSDDSSIPF